VTHLNLAKPKAWRPSFPDTVTGEIGRMTNRPDDPTEMEDFDPDETPPMPRPAFRIEEWDAEGKR
jgi:hypothetical protein